MALVQDHHPDSSGRSSRLKVIVRGAVQGVGFRPFVYRLASDLQLRGWINNSASGVVIEAEATRARLEIFLQRLKTDKPPHALLHDLECQWLEAVGYPDFQILQSDQASSKTTLVLPDLATCADCRREIFDPQNRRFHYPFTNCTNCGPRFTIVEALPYDRVRTSMRGFAMCPACRAEYGEPGDRRFHAQPNACPDCGPTAELWERQGTHLESGYAALEKAAAALRDGAIVAIKGLGGFQLFAAAHREDTIGRLRRGKRRAARPFALMFPSLSDVRSECECSQLEEDLLASVQAPIVLLNRKRRSVDRESAVCELVAPGNPCLGVMLPSTPLHHLLMQSLAFPVVATSGNLSEEPICIDEHDALQRLSGIADFFLVHNRPIVRHADDSIARVMAGREMILRRARGYAPLPIQMGEESAFQLERVNQPVNSAVANSKTDAGDCILAVGAHLKNAIALAIGREAFVSQHIGDLETTQAYEAFQRVISDFQRFYEVLPKCIVADAHPDYLSTRYAEQTHLPVLHVQHHYAHVLSCMAEHGLHDAVCGVAWDGTGLGTDGTIWGGEFLTLTPDGFHRFAHLRPFPLPGGDKAIKEPRRSALGMLFEAFGDAALDTPELPLKEALSQIELGAFRRMLRQKINAPLTSSAGRLFDGVAALIGLRQRADFEGQAAMDLEFACAEGPVNDAYPLPLVDLPVDQASPGTSRTEMGSLMLDWIPLLRALLEDQRKNLPGGLISRRFHNALVAGIVAVAERAGQPDVVLSGGCFQNKVLTELAVTRLQEAGLRPYWHRQVPPNDGGIALGQVIAARRIKNR